MDATGGDDGTTQPRGADRGDGEFVAIPIGIVGQYIDEGGGVAGGLHAVFHGSGDIVAFPDEEGEGGPVADVAIGIGNPVAIGDLPAEVGGGGKEGLVPGNDKGACRHGAHGLDVHEVEGGVGCAAVILESEGAHHAVLKRHAPVGVLHKGQAAGTCHRHAVFMDHGEGDRNGGLFSTGVPRGVVDGLGSEPVGLRGVDVASVSGFLEAAVFGLGDGGDGEIRAAVVCQHVKGDGGGLSAW